MNVAKILAQAESAADDHFQYAHFVNASELPQTDSVAFPTDGQRSAYEQCWFELEIVNALALDEWESDGKPAVWLEPWNQRYKNDAKELIGKLSALLRDDRS
ncbi:hypothetical protein [Paraburkholderia sp.]|uniref:hypothetical protein n=1 Tax=Paraburkholderia sp. TaxID=1926495 RepID=UPI002D5FDFF4|nr:hypothetical protein [Paraburkholderia sp.]HZZ06288.1 hypothetical protein [Paraburkholderia sp.]